MIVDTDYQPLPFYLAPESPQNKDTLHVVMSDMHSGSNYALFIKGTWEGTKGNNHTATSKQVKIRNHFEIFAEELKQARQGKQVKLIHNGDAIDGDHHNSGDVCTTNPLEQARIHVDLMEEFKQRIDWQAGDLLYYTRGTQTHVNEFENWIGEQVNAVPDGDFYVHDLLKLWTNGNLSLFAHHGPSRGDGANEGNSMRNFLRNVQQEAVKDNRIIPDVLWTSHVHYPTYSPYGYRANGMNFKNMHGIITPAWQLKTSFGWQVAALKQEKIGGVYQEIKADGTICIPKFSIMETE